MKMSMKKEYERLGRHVKAIETLRKPWTRKTRAEYNALITRMRLLEGATPAPAKRRPRHAPLEVGQEVILKKDEDLALANGMDESVRFAAGTTASVIVPRLLNGNVVVEIYLFDKGRDNYEVERSKIRIVTAKDKSKNSNFAEWFEGQFGPPPIKPRNEELVKSEVAALRIKLAKLETDLARQRVYDRERRAAGYAWAAKGKGNNG